MKRDIYDVAVIGGGPGGYTAALYCARSGLSVLVLEKMSPGGQMATTSVVDNYPGFEEGIDGFELGEKMQRQAERFGAETSFVNVTAVDLKQDIKTIETSKGQVKPERLSSPQAHPQERSDCLRNHPCADVVLPTVPPVMG